MTDATRRGTRNDTVQALKLLFLLVICYGHIFAEGPAATLPGSTLMDGLPMRLWWVPGDVGLFFFTATSGYFTALRYPGAAMMQGYWRRKVSRLCGLFLFLNAVLGCVFLATGREGVFTWDALVNLLGLNGFLNWFHLGNDSPFGAGQWFFTLLLLFYLVYPVMNRAVTTPARGRLLLWGCVALAAVMQVRLPYGHSLWSTSVGFVAGFWLARFGGSHPARSGWFALCACLAGAVAYRFIGHLPVLAYSVIGLAGYVCTVLALTVRLPLLPARVLDAVGDLMLPLYIIHTYFRLPLAQDPYLDALLVLTMNAGIAWVLLKAYALLAGRRRHAGPPTVAPRGAGMAGSGVPGPGTGGRAKPVASPALAAKAHHAANAETPSPQAPATHEPAVQASSGLTPAGQTASGQTASGQTPSGQTPSGQTLSAQALSGQTYSGQTLSGRSSPGQQSSPLPAGTKGEGTP